MNLYLDLTDFAAISPLLIVLFGALFMLLLESFAEKWTKGYFALLTMGILVAAFLASCYSPISHNPLLTSWILFDALGRFFTLFFLLIGLSAALLSFTFFQKFEATQGEYYFLLLSSLFGLILIGLSADFLTLFLGIETLSISLYILCGYMKKWKLSHESAIKYFLMGSIAAAFLLYGIALIYGAVGTTRFDHLLEGYQRLSSSTESHLFLSGIVLITLAFSFEAAIVPLQVWAPDVYEGSPTPITAFMAVGTKVGAFAAFIRVFFDALPQFNPIWNEAIAWLAYPTLIYANFVAIRQTQLRRFFAYSGISHAGFLFIPLAAGTAEALPAMLFYLIVYAFSTLGAFAVIGLLDRDSGGVSIADLRGLFRRSPALAIVLAICLLTLAGIPPTIGFFAKFYIFEVAFEAGFYGLVIVGLLMTILSVYYYLRIIGMMFAEAPLEAGRPQLSWTSVFLSGASLAAILLLSFFPAPLIELLALK